MNLTALPGVPEVAPGDDLAALLRAAAAGIGGLAPDDVLVVAQKVVSKAEGAVVDLADVRAGERAARLAAEHGKDPRLVQVVLDDTADLLRADAGRLICRTYHGFVCANAGVDLSNAGGLPDRAIRLPRDPDASARALRAALGCAVVVGDSWGRPWRLGQVEVAIGCAGVAPLADYRGARDADGRELHATAIAAPDELAAAADLVRRKDSREPAVRIRGFAGVLDHDGPGAAALLRAPADDLFR